MLVSRIGHDNVMEINVWELLKIETDLHYSEEDTFGMDLDTSPILITLEKSKLTKLLKLK